MVKQPGGEMNGNAAEVTTTPFAFTSMYRRPNLETKARCACRDRASTGDRRGGAIKRDQETIAGVLDLRSAEPAYLRPFVWNPQCP
jgi:hypothetical protein